MQLSPLKEVVNNADQLLSEIGCRIVSTVFLHTDEVHACYNAIGVFETFYDKTGPLCC